MRNVSGNTKLIWKCKIKLVIYLLNKKLHPLNCEILKVHSFWTKIKKILYAKIYKNEVN